MERYKVNGADLRGHYRDDAILEDVFRDIERELKAEQRVVCQYIVNGMTILEKDEPRFGAYALTQVETLEYLSESTDVLLADVIAGWIDAIPELQAGADAMAARLRAGASQGLIKAMHDLVENCQLLMDSISSARHLIGSPDTFARFDELSELTQKTFSEAMRHLESQDFVQLAQVIEYDLNHGLEEWLGLLKHVEQGRRNDGTAEPADRMVRKGSAGG